MAMPTTSTNSTTTTVADRVDTRQQIILFLNNILNFPSTNALLHEVLSARGLEVTMKTPISSLCEIPHGIDDTNKEAFRAYAIPRLTLIKQRYFDKNGHALKDEELKKVLPSLAENFLSGDKEKDIGENPTNPTELALPTLELPNIPLQPGATRHRNNKEQSILQFISLCRESKSITSSVDMYNNYRRWCTNNGFGYCSAPTLTKYLRESDRKQTESVSEKGRSQGWYLITP